MRIIDVAVSECYASKYYISSNSNELQFKEGGT
jgi:hypothetical protein